MAVWVWKDWVLAVVSFVKKGKLGGEYILDSHSTVPAKHTNLAYIILFVQWHPMGFFFLLFQFQMVMMHIEVQPFNFIDSSVISLLYWIYKGKSVAFFSLGIGYILQDNFQSFYSFSERSMRQTTICLGYPYIISGYKDCFL